MAQGLFVYNGCENLTINYSIEQQYYLVNID